MENDALVDRPLKVLAGLEEMEIVMVGTGAWAPDNGAIPMYRKGGKTDGGLIGYVSVLPAPDGSACRPPRSMTTKASRYVSMSS